MLSIEIKEKILSNAGSCPALLQELQQAKLSKQDLAQAVADADDDWYPIHEIMRSCHGEGIYEVVEYIVTLNPECIWQKDQMGNLPLHVMPRFSQSQKEAIQTNQLAARRLLWSQHPEALKETNARGETPLVKAIILEYNVFVASIAADFPQLLNRLDDRGMTPLNSSIEAFNEKAVTMFLMVHPESIETILKMNDLPAGDVADRQRILTAIADALPDAFEVSCDCDNEHTVCECHIGKSLVRQFFKETPLTEWGQDFLWRLMKSSLYRKKQALPDKILKLETEIASTRTVKEKLQSSLTETRESLEKTIDELGEFKAELKVAKENVEQHKALAQEQEAKYLEMATKIQELQETRNFYSENKILSKIDNEWSVVELKAVLESLIQRLEYLIPEHTKFSMAHIAGSYLVKDEDAPKERLIDTIEALNKELLDL